MSSNIWRSLWTVLVVVTIALRSFVSSQTACYLTCNGKCTGMIVDPVSIARVLCIDSACASGIVPRKAHQKIGLINKWCYKINTVKTNEKFSILLLSINNTYLECSLLIFQILDAISNPHFQHSLHVVLETFGPEAVNIITDLGPQISSSLRKV